MPIKISAAAQPTLNLTPMLDVVFLLIIFFMVGTKFAEMERRIEVNVPEVGHAGPLTSAPEKRVIHVTSQGEVFLDDAPVTIDELAAAIAADVEKFPQQSVLIRGDGNSGFQRVADVLSVCKHAGVAELAISVKTPKTVR
ncbi:MAG: biopolymer transporter ExbD [Pirellulales bacterium]|nr:biopolymer transporter ExbD [Planctomycetales bacterium]